jgi:branched-chain amino acid transport system substrate-binding protein
MPRGQLRWTYPPEDFMGAIRRLFTAVAAAALLTSPLASAAVDPVEVNVIIPMTGGAAFIGKGYSAAFHALEIAININGGIADRPLHFVVQDDQSNPQVAVQLFSALLDKNVPVVLGAALVAECNAMKAMLKDGPLLYCLTPAVHPDAGSYVFSADPSTNDQLAASIHYFHARGITRIAILTSTDASGQDADTTIAGAMDVPMNHGVTEVAHEHFNVTDLSVQAQIERIKAANPQLLIAWTTGTPFATILRAVNDAGLQIPVYTNSGNLTYAQMTAYHDFLPKELYFPAVACVVPDGITDKGVKAATSDYFQALHDTGVKPEYIMSVAYDPALLVVTALRALGPNASAAKIRNYINSLGKWSGASGRYNFKATPQRGLDLSQIFVARWDGAQNNWVAVSKPGGDPR